MDKTKCILLSAVIVCIMSKTFCGIGLSGLLCKDQDRVSEDQMQIEENYYNEVKRKKRSYAWIISGLIIFVLWTITAKIICE